MRSRHRVAFVVLSGFRFAGSGRVSPLSKAVGNPGRGISSKRRITAALGKIGYQGGATHLGESFRMFEGRR